MTRRSTICLVCASYQKLRFSPCEEHEEALDPSTCPHERTALALIHNGQGTRCYDCGDTYDIETYELVEEIAR
jgi:hypothetical protein